MVDELARALGYSSADEPRAAEAIRLASGTLGRCAAAHELFQTWQHSQGRPRERARRHAIQDLRQLFSRYDAGRVWGRGRHEMTFIALCLRDACLGRYHGLWHYWRNEEPRTMRAPGVGERFTLIEWIADHTDQERAGQLLELPDEAARRRAIDAARFAPDPWPWPDETK